jgi:nitronate monooxygenase
LFIVSGPDLVIAQCKAGIVGSFPALNARPAEMLDKWIERIKNELDEHEQKTGKKAAPFAVNQIVHASNDRVMHDMQVCVKHKVPILITSLRAPAEIVKAAHGYGGVVFHDVINIRHAKKAAEEGVDGLILVCAGAGGHAGTRRPSRSCPKCARGSTRRSCSRARSRTGQACSLQAMGADLAYLGTRFIATSEANADARYKQMLVDTMAGDIIYSNLFTGVHGNYLGPSVKAAGLDPANLPEADKSKMNFGSGGNMEKKAWKDIWGAGQGVGQIEAITSVADVVAKLAREYQEAKRRLAA